MPCYMRASKQQREQAIERLKKKIKDGQVSITNTNGSLGLSGWELEDRAGFCDECALEELRNDSFFYQEQIAPLENGMTSGFSGGW